MTEIMAPRRAFLLRLETYLCDHTGLPRAAVKLVMDAHKQFYAEHPGHLQMAASVGRDRG